MALSDDINNLPSEVTPGQTGHAVFHTTLHKGLKDAYTKVTYALSELGNKVGFTDLTATQTLLQTSIDGKASTSHTHTIANVTNLQTTLDGKAPTSHTHAISSITSLQTALDGKAATSHTHTIANISASGTPSSTTYLRGDGTWATPAGGGSGGASSADDILDASTIGKNILRAADASAVRTIIGGVNSVNSLTGNVTLAASDVGAVPTARTISAGSGLTGGGDLTANRSVALNSTSIASLAKADTAVQGSGLTLWTGTAAAYAAIGTKSSTTLYAVTA